MSSLLNTAANTPRSFKNNSSNYKELNNIWNQMFDLVSKKVNVNQYNNLIKGSC